MDQQLEFNAIKGVIRRRRKIFLLTYILISFTAVTYAVILPSSYRSEATIRIEAQQIPEEYVRSTITTYVEERIDTISRQVMSRKKLLDIINHLNLFSSFREKYSTTELLQKLRKNIQLETISSDFTSRLTGKHSEATIAFTISYESKFPEIAQKVTQKLASLYLEEDLRSRKKLASQTTEFLEEEMQGYKAQIILLGKNIGEFEKDHFGELPEYNATNFQNMTKLEYEVDQTELQIRSLQEKRIYLAGQLAVIDPFVSVIRTREETAVDPAGRLKQLRIELIRLKSVLSEKHPDIKQLKKEIKELEMQVGTSDDYQAKIYRLKEIDKELASVRRKLGSKHPDLIKLKKEKRLLSKELGRFPANSSYPAMDEEKPDNPTYTNLKIQIASVDMQIDNLTLEKKIMLEELEGYREKLRNAPVVANEYNELTRDYESAQGKYNEILNKLMEAKIAEGMEEKKRGEQFKIIDPAYLPEKPYKPNRIAIVLLGIVLAFGASTGLAAAKEFMDHSVKSADELHNLTGVPVFSVISYVESDNEKRTRRLRRGMWVLVTMAGISGVLVVVSTFFVSLDSLWPKIQHKIDMIRLSF